MKTTNSALLYKAPSTLRWKNLKTLLNFSGLTYRPHQPVTEKELLENAIQTGKFKNGVFAL